MAPPNLDPNKVADLMRQLRPDELQAMHQFLYQAHTGAGGFDKSPFNPDKVSVGWQAVQQAVAQPAGAPSGAGPAWEGLGHRLHEAVAGPGTFFGTPEAHGLGYDVTHPKEALSEAWSLAQKPLVNLQALQPPGTAAQHPILAGVTRAGAGLTSPSNVGLMGATAALPAKLGVWASRVFAAQMAVGHIQEARQFADAYHRGDHNAMLQIAGQAGVELPFTAGALAHGLTRAGSVPVETGTAADVPQEIPKENLTRATPLDDTGKYGVTKDLLRIKARAIAGPALAHGETVGLPEIRATVKAAPEMAAPTTPEVSPIREAQLSHIAAITEAEPNPTAKPVELPKIVAKPEVNTGQATIEAVKSPASPQKIEETRVAAQPTLDQASSSALLEKPVYPGKGATLADKQAYAAQRDAWMKQQVNNKPVDAKSNTPANQIDQGVKRILKASDQADLVRRHGEFKRLLTNTDADPDLVSNLRARSQQFAAQASEARRVAAAPAKLATMADAKGQSLLGEWNRTVPGEREEQLVGDNKPFYRTVNVNEVPPAERDVLHKLMGHGTSEVLTRDESGKPLKVHLDDAEVQKFVDTTQSALDKEMDLWKSSGMTPTPDAMEKMADLQDILEKTTGLRNRLSVTGPRKGLPVTDEQGVINAPGAIPDIGRTTSNALMGKPLGAHFRKADPARLAARADQFEQASRLYDAAATHLEKRLGPTSLKETGYKLYTQLHGTESSRPQLLGRLSDFLRGPQFEAQLKEMGHDPEVFGMNVQNPEEGARTFRRKSGEPTILLNSKTARRLNPDELNSLLNHELGHALDIAKGGALEAEANPADRYTKPQASYKPAAFTGEGFPAGPVANKVSDTVSALHAMVDPEHATWLAEAVKAQGLGTRDAAYRLYGRALAAASKGDLQKGLDIANRVGEHGALRLGFLGNFLRNMHDRLTPGARPEGPKERVRGTIREQNAIEKQELVRKNNQLDASDKMWRNMSDAELAKIPEHTPAVNATAQRWHGKNFSELSKPDQRAVAGFAFQKDIQSGEWRDKYAPGSWQYKQAELLRGMLDENREQIQAARPGALKQFDENYFGQRWKGINNLGEYTARVYGAKAPLTKANFLREKYHASLQAGEDAGLLPRETNPVRAAMNILAEGAHFRKGQAILDDLRDHEWLRTFKSPSRVDKGWEPLDAKVAGPGKYAPHDVAKVFNKFFRPGFMSDHPGLDTIRIYNNAALMGAVNLSGFHPLLVLGESLATDLSLIGKTTLSSLVHPEMFPSIFKSILLQNPLSSIPSSFYKGITGLREYKLAGSPGHEEFPAWLKLGMKGGIQPGVSKIFDTESFGSIKKNWNEAAFRAGEFLKARQYPAARSEAWRAANEALRMIPAAFRLLNSPIMDGIVKTVKLGSTRKMLEYELEKLGPGATEAEQRAAAREISDGADDRFGQMVSDNLFWSNNVRDASTLAFKFVDYAYGTIRAGSGAVADVPRALVGGGLSHRLAHAFGLAMTWATMGAALNYMLTGAAPKSNEDIFAPRNGHLDANGNPERVFVHGYERSYYELSQPPINVAKGDFYNAVKNTGSLLTARLSPAATVLRDLWTGHDWAGAPIINRNDPAISQLGSIVKDIAKQATPISINTMFRVDQLGGSTRDKALSMAGIQPLPRSMQFDRPPAETELSQQLREFHGQAGPEVVAHERAISALVAAERNHSGKFGEIWKQEVAAGHLDGSSDKDIDTVIERFNHPFLEQVKQLPLARQVAVLEKTQTPYERATVADALKLDSLVGMPEAERTKLWQRISAAYRQPYKQK